MLELGFFDSKQKAQSCIMTNGVSINGKLVNKPGFQINYSKFLEHYQNDSEYIKVADKFLAYVSRGAYKLQTAAKKYNLNFSNKIVLDIGASTGGFCDFVLQHEAQKVIALDVGKGQLHYKLQQDTRVLNLEEINFRFWQMQELGEDCQIDMVLCDVSFISILIILERLKELISTKPNKFNANLEIIFLLKPQFEAGKKIMDKCQGVLKDEKLIQEICDQSCQAINKLGFQVLDICPSELKGAKGNQEFLLNLQLDPVIFA